MSGTNLYAMGMSGVLRRLIILVVAACCALSLAGCNFKLSIDGEGKVLMIPEDGGANPSIKTCVDTCRKTNLDGNVILEAVPAEGHTFLGYSSTGSAPFDSWDRYSTRAYFGLYFSFDGPRFIDTNVTAVFHKTDDILDYRDSDSYFCILSKADGLLCWYRAENKKVEIDSANIPHTEKFVDQISVGTSHICAINNDALNCWGGAALDFSHLQNPSQVVSRHGTSCAIAASGIVDRGVVCWDQFGFRSDVPANIVNPREIQVAGYQSCAIADSGVHCWGYSDSILEQGFVAPHGLVIGGSLSGCLLDGDRVECWGDLVPLEDSQPASLMNPRQLDVLGLNACVLDDNGVQCWGDDTRYQQIPALIHPRQIEFAGSVACALDDNGTACWGGNFYRGQARNVPQNLVNPKQVVAGNLHTCALDDNGVTCWGGEDGHYDDLVPALDHPAALATSGDRTCAIDGNRVVCWDYDGVTVKNGLNGISLLDIGHYGQNCAVDDSGLHCWGNVFSSDYDFSIPSITKLTATGDFACVVSENPPQPNEFGCWRHDTQQPIGPDTLTMYGVWDLQMDNVTDLVSPTTNWNEQRLCLMSQQNSKCFGYPGSALEQRNPKADELSLGYDFHCKVLNGKTSCSGRGQGYKESFYDLRQSAPPAGLTADAHSLTTGLYHACVIDQGKVVCWGEGPVTKLY